MLINGRTPAQIKAGLRCGKGDVQPKCTDCAYLGYYDEEFEVQHFDCGEIDVDALAYIEQLEFAMKCEQVARTVMMEEVPKWIKVVDRMPESEDEKSDCYLVTDGTFIWMAYYACKEWQFAECTDSPYVIDWTEITHWMPLPQPPEV